MWRYWFWLSGCVRAMTYYYFRVYHIFFFPWYDWMRITFSMSAFVEGGLDEKAEGAMGTRLVVYYSLHSLFMCMYHTLLHTTRLLQFALYRYSTHPHTNASAHHPALSAACRIWHVCPGLHK